MSRQNFFVNGEQCLAAAHRIVRRVVADQRRAGHKLEPALQAAAAYLGRTPRSIRALHYLNEPVSFRPSELSPLTRRLAEYLLAEADRLDARAATLRAESSAITAAAAHVSPEGGHPWSGSGLSSGSEASA